MLFDVMSVSTLNPAGGRRYVRCTSKEPNSTTTGVAIKLSGKMLYLPSFPSTTPIAGLVKQHEAAPLINCSARQAPNLYRSGTEMENSEPNDSGEADCNQESREFSVSRLESLQHRLSEATKVNFELKDALQNVKAENEELKHHLDQTTAQSEKLKQFLDKLDTENEKLRNEASRQKHLVEAREFCFENIQDSKFDVLFYTGLPSSSVFYQLFHYLNPEGIRSNVVYSATAQSCMGSEPECRSSQCIMEGDKSHSRMST